MRIIDPTPYDNGPSSIVARWHRRRRTFLWMPLTLGGESRWLEWATILEYSDDCVAWEVVDFCR